MYKVQKVQNPSFERSREHDKQLYDGKGKITLQKENALKINFRTVLKDVHEKRSK